MFVSFFMNGFRAEPSEDARDNHFDAMIGAWKTRVMRRS